MEKVIIFGASSQLAIYVKYILKRRGAYILEFSNTLHKDFSERERMELKLELERGANYSIFWFHGFSRPSDKDINLQRHLRGSIIYLADFINDFSVYHKQLRFNFTGSILQLQGVDKTLYHSDSYILAKNFSARLVKDGFPNHKIWLLGNNEGLLRPYSHWLQDVLRNMMYYRTGDLDEIRPVSVYKNRMILLNLTAEIAVAMTQQNNFYNEDVGEVVASRIIPVCISDLVDQFCGYSNCAPYDLGITYDSSLKEIGGGDLELSGIPVDLYFDKLPVFCLNDLFRLFDMYQRVVNFESGFN